MALEVTDWVIMAANVVSDSNRDFPSNFETGDERAGHAVETYDGGSREGLRSVCLG